MKDLCLLDGVIRPLAETRIDPLDRGFLFGDALYEVVKVTSGVILHLEPHLERLCRGLDRLHIPAPEDLEKHCRNLTMAAEMDNGYLYLQVSRGAAPRSHLPPSDIRPTLFILLQPFEYSPVGANPHRLSSLRDPRWLHCDLKTTSLLATVMGKLEVRDQGRHEILFVDPAGAVREGGSCNFFARRRDMLETAPLNGRILPGITRADLLRFAADLDLEVAERAPHLAERHEWSEAFVCGTLTLVQPVVEIDGKEIGGGACGPWTRALGERLSSWEEELVREGVSA